MSLPPCDRLTWTTGSLLLPELEDEMFSETWIVVYRAAVVKDLFAFLEIHHDADEKIQHPRGRMQVLGLGASKKANEAQVAKHTSRPLVER
jgi:hypothetical protein